MQNLHTPAGAIYLMQILASAFLAILFLQSGIDKVVDRRGNLEWLNGHFAKSPLAGFVPLMVTAITILEIIAGGLSAVGCAVILFSRDSTLAFFGAIVAAVSIVALFSGTEARIMRERPRSALFPADASGHLLLHSLSWWRRPPSWRASFQCLDLVGLMILRQPNAQSSS